jgi:hypothetical protein
MDERAEIRDALCLADSPDVLIFRILGTVRLSFGVAQLKALHPLPGGGGMFQSIISAISVAAAPRKP